MTALQALQQARLDTSKYARPIEWRSIRRAVRYCQPQGVPTWIMFEYIENGREDLGIRPGLNRFGFIRSMLAPENIISDDGSSVEWEIVSESEL